jgi:hypothetical protein
VVLKRPGLLCLVEDAMLGHKLCKSLDLFVFVSKVHDIVQLHNLSVEFLLRVPRASVCKQREFKDASCFIAHSQKLSLVGLVFESHSLVCFVDSLRQFNVFAI